jgi:integrase/recombinase XerD
MTDSPHPNLPRLLESFFTDRLMRQRQVSPHTIASYRDTFRLLLEFVQPRLKKAPSALSIEDLDAPLLGAFLDHLEKDRGNSPRTRNVRLAAIHSFFKYAAFHQPAQSEVIQRVLAIPSKRYDRSPIEFLTRDEIDALLAAPDQETWIGRRDRALILLVAQAGLRVSELVSLRCQDLSLGRGAHVRCQGKGRKERCTPLRKDAVRVLRAWSREQKGQADDPLFPTIHGGHLSRDAVEHLLAKHAATARRGCPSLRQKRVSPHSLRHGAAMDLLQHGVDPSVIALWLGHESIETTQIYIHANMALKEAAIARTTPSKVRAGRYRPGDRLLAFLKSL